MDYRLANCILRFFTDDKELDSFIQHHCNLEKDSSEKGSPNIYVNFSQKNFEISKNTVRIARNIWIGNYSVFISEIEIFPGLKLKIQIDQNTLYVDAFLAKKDRTLAGRITSFFRSKNKFEELKFIVLNYYLILVPFFYYLEHFNGLSLLHASAIELNGKGVVLSGLGGVGKSTFSLGTLFLKSSKFISDNLILFDNEKIYSCPEAIALDNKSIQILDGIKQYLVPRDIKYSHGRVWYHVNPEVIIHETTPKYLFWLQWGDKNEVIPIEKKTCIKYLLQINLLAKEVREYSMIAAALNLNFPQVTPSEKHYEKLDYLLSNVDCNILRFRPGIDIKKAINETIVEIIS